MTAREFIPREHGAWAMWIVPMLSAALVTRFSFVFVVLFVCFTLLYIVHHPVVAMIKRKSIEGWKEVAALAIPGILLGSALVIFGGLPWLLVFGAVEAVVFSVSIKSFVSRDQRSFASELITVAALTLSAPAAYYTISGTLGVKAALLYALNFLFFASSVFYVKLKIESLRSKGTWRGEARKALYMMIAYHVFLVVALLAAAVLGIISGWVLAGFVPVIIQVSAGTLSRGTKMNFTRLGIALVVQSVIFLSAVGMFLR
jgi:YwiC-like protein